MKYRSVYEVQGVPDDFYDDVADACGQWWADAMLHKAAIRPAQGGAVLTFRTRTAHDCAARDARFVSIAAALKLKLVRPEAYRGPG